MSIEALKPADRLALAEAPRRRTVIQATHGWAGLDLEELWQFRDLLLLLGWRDIKVRYKQTVLGAAWAVIQPVINMIIFTILFSRVAHLPSGGMPYPIFTFAALVPWTYFAYVLAQSGNSLVANAGMISKVYFPRLVLPLSSVLSGFVDFVIALALLGVLMVWYGVRPGLGLVTLPLFVVLLVLAAYSAGLWLSALNVKYRDVRYTLPFLIQVWLYASPVAYSAGLVHGKLAFVYALNPMAGVIDGFRWALLDIGPAPNMTLAPSIIVTLLFLSTGLLYFRRVERTFADIA